MKQTAVGLLKQKLLNDQQKFPIYNEYINGVINYLDNQLLEMKKQDEFAIDFIKWTISQEAEDLIYDLKMVGEVSKIPTPEEMLKVYKRFKNK